MATTAAELPGKSFARSKAVRAARRHSRLVRASRIALPVSALLLLVAVSAAIVTDPRVQLADVDAESLGITGSKIVMRRPRLTGFSEGADARGYEVTAERAEQDMTKPDEVDLHDLTARMELNNQGWARLVAKLGHMNSKTQTLDLSDAIEVTTDVNDRANLTQAQVNFALGEITSSQRVHLKMSRADLSADSMHLYEAGNRAVFSGKVVMVLHPERAAVAPMELR